MPQRSYHRRQMRVPLSAEAWFSWGYQRQRCAVTEFSPDGLTVTDLDAATGTPVAIQLMLPEGDFSLCGIVMHHVAGSGVAGVKLLELPTELQSVLEVFLWDLLADSAMPGDDKVCSVIGCDRQRKARGYCSKHYNRWRRQRAQKSTAG